MGHCTVIIGLNVKLVINEITGWMEARRCKMQIVWCTAVPVVIAAGYCSLHHLQAMVERAKEKQATMPHGSATVLTDLEKPIYTYIAICIDFQWD